MENNYFTNGSITTIYFKRKNGEILKGFIDTEDLERIKNIKWSLCWNGNKNPYVSDSDSKLLHRIILNAPNLETTYELLMEAANYMEETEIYNKNELPDILQNLGFEELEQEYSKRAGISKETLKILIETAKKIDSKEIT